MKNATTLLIGLFTSIITFAGNYEPLLNGYTMGYGPTGMDVSIDSVKTKNDSIFTYPSHSILDLSGQYNCFNPNSSILGNKIYFNNDSLVLFNVENEAILIKTKSSLNEEWTAYSNNVITIIAKTEDCSLTSVLGNSDSVKTISFKTYDKNSVALNYQLDNYKIKISKNHGLIQSVNFAAFPNHTISEEFIVQSITANNRLHNLTWSEVYDINVGDEIHSIETYYNYYPSLIDKTTYTINKYLEKEIKSDTIIFKIDRTRKIVSTVNSVQSTSYVHDTINEKIIEIPYFNTQVLKPIKIYDRYIRLYPTLILNLKGKIIPSSIEEIFGDGFQICYIFSTSDGCFPSNSYYKGLGGPYYSCDGNGMAVSLEPVYYKKGSETAGTPIVITNTEEQKQNSLGTIFPNPAKDKISVKSNEAVSIEIKNLQGKTLKQKELKDATTEISITDLIPGVYIYKITNSKHEFSSGKLIVE